MANSGHPVIHSRGRVAELVAEGMLRGRAPALSLDPFTTSFIECGLASCSIDEDGSRPLRSKYTRLDIDIVSLAQMYDECLTFQQRCMNWYILPSHYLGNKMGFEINGGGQRACESLAGSDFWLTRAGAGAGFWDGDWVYGDVLADACKNFGTPDLYVGDDGRIYYV